MFICSWKKISPYANRWYRYRYLKESETEWKRILHLLVHFSTGCDDWDWTKPKVGARNSFRSPTWLAVTQGSGNRPLLPQVRSQEASWISRNWDWHLLRAAGVAVGGLTWWDTTQTHLWHFKNIHSWHLGESWFWHQLSFAAGTEEKQTPSWVVD